MLKKNLKLRDLVTADGYVNIPITSLFSTETQQYEFIENNFEKVKSGYINENVDLEKVKIEPYYLSGQILAMVYSISFKPHFLINGTWTIDTTKLTEIGFTDEDIIYKRKKIENSFIRFLFYDSEDPRTQNLLYYSTAFLDGNEIYSQYINDGLVANITSKIYIEHPKYTNNFKTSDGFNIYLFKNDILKNEIKTIYMSVEFNNASDGKTTLFTKNKPSESGYTMSEFYNNAYFKILIKFDENEKKYLYWFDGISAINSTSENKKIKNLLELELYQAKII